ncbi:MAG: TolC family protein [Polyangiaceae bacterium]|nr:TolC family protein [Polyangiaceae bacterium]
MRTLLASLPLVLASVVTPLSAFAQSAPAARPAPAAPAAGQAAPVAQAAPGAAGAAGPRPAGAPSPTQPTLPSKEEDPLLQPVPPPAKLVSGWRDALSLVRTRSTDLQIALQDVERADAQARVALAGLLPTLSANLSAQQALGRTVNNPVRNTPEVEYFTGNATSYSASGTLTVPIIAPRAWYAQGTAERQQIFAERNVASQKRLLAAALARALVSVITAERVSELNKVGLRTALERLELTRRRLALGAANGLDVIRVEQDAAIARATIVTGDESLRQAREALGLALGVPESVGVPADLSLDAFAQESERVCRKGATVADRPDVQAAEAQVEVSRRGVGDVEAQFYPTLNLQSVYTRSQTPFVILQVNPNNPAGEPIRLSDRVNATNWTIAGVLSWNIFDGGVRYGQLRDTRAQVVQAEQRAEATRRNASIEVTRSLRGVKVADDAQRVSQQTRDLARETDRLTRANFELGRGTSLDLVDAARRLRESEIQLAVREFEAIQAKITALLALSQCEY